jgi:hypothetical protein
MTSGSALATEQHVDDVTAALSAQNDILEPLRVVLSKLDLFVKIVDKITDVCAHPVIHIVVCALNKRQYLVDPSLRQSGMGGGVCSIQRELVAVNSIIFVC